MQNIQSRNSLFSHLVIDNKMNIIEVTNFDTQLFFGKQPIVGKTIYEVAGKEFEPQIKDIIDGVEVTWCEKRNSCFVYSSVYSATERVLVCAHVEYQSDEIAVLYLTMVHSDDLKKASTQKEAKLNDMLHTIYENLPASLEVYDREGRMIEINAFGVQGIGLESKEEILGVSLYDNPFLSDDIKARLRAGENMRFTVEYDFSKIGKFINTSASDIRHIDISVAVLRDRSGEIEKYIIISQDVTNLVVLKKKYKNLYNQNVTVLNSLPVGVGIYSSDGTMIYPNDMYCQIFGIDRQMILKIPHKIADSPMAPRSAKKAIKDGSVIDLEFTYDFAQARSMGCIESSHDQARQLECKGRPIFDNNGKLENYVFIMNDITEKLEKETLVKQSQRKIEMAMQSADITLWEFDVKKNVFFSDNEPLNGYDNSKPVTFAQYLDTVHPDEQEMVDHYMQFLLAGENRTLSIEVRCIFPHTEGYQYCTVDSAPYEMDDTGKVAKYVGVRKNNTRLHKRKLLQDKILNSIPLSIHIKDIEDDYRYVFCNDEGKRLFGTSERSTGYDVMNEDVVARIRKTDLEVFTTNKPYLGAEQVVLKNGLIYDTIVQKSIIEEDGKRLLLSIRWDQSIQNDLKRRSKLLSVTMETMNAYTWFYEPEKERINFGDGFDKIGRKSSEIDTLEKFMMCIHPDDVTLFTESLQMALEGKSDIWEVEGRFDLNGDKKYSWWETRGVVECAMIDEVPQKYMFGMTICIEPHKQAELTLLRNKDQLNHLIHQNDLILNNTNSGLAYITTDYIVQWENISVCSSSLSFEAYKKGVQCYKSAHNRTSPCKNCVLQRALVSKQLEQIQFTLKNNRMVEIFATPVFNENGEMDGIVIRVDDITERQKMIEEIKRAKALAEQSDKLKSAFLANMSHEIRTPLNAIVGFSELLVHTEDKEERTEYTQIISDNNELLLKLISDILDLSKIEAGSVEFKYEEFDLSDYFNGITISMRQRIKNPNVRLISTNPYKSCLVNLDKNRVAQIIANYVTNSIKYTPRGFIEMGYSCCEECVRIYVKDSGIGIPENKKNKVFHRFAKLDEFAQGTGLGLSICKAIAESMGGHVGFESTHNEGSLFWVTFPCTPIAELSLEITETNFIPEAISVTKAETTLDVDNITLDNRKTILIAEDIPSNYLLLSKILKNKFILLHAVNGELAIELARNNRVDLVLMDMKMPVLDGLKATAEIRKFDTQLPIVALTAHAFENDHVAALEVGCNEFLVKPIDKARLIAVLKKYCSA